MDVPILGGPFNGGAIHAPRRTTAGLLVTLASGGVSAEYRLASLDGAVTAVPSDLVDDAPPYALRTTIDEYWERELRLVARSEPTAL
jgi:hypothetical protein